MSGLGDTGVSVSKEKKHVFCQLWLPSAGFLGVGWEWGGAVSLLLEPLMQSQLLWPSVRETLSFSQSHFVQDKPLDSCVDPVFVFQRQEFHRRNGGPKRPQIPHSCSLQACFSHLVGLKWVTSRIFSGSLKGSEQTQNVEL